MTNIPRFDLHTHTVYSHGKGTVEQNVEAAIKKGLKRIAISEHAPAHFLYGVRGERLFALRREVDEMARKYARDIEVLMGVECNLTAYGECDFPKEGPACDVALLAYHKGVIPKDSLVWGATAEAFHVGKSDPVRIANALLEAADKYKIGMLSHPSLYVKCDIDTLSRGARELGILLEINGSRVTMSKDELQLAAKNGARFVMNSDAHTPERVGDVQKAIDAANEAGVLPLVLGFEDAT